MIKSGGTAKRAKKISKYIYLVYSVDKTKNEGKVCESCKPGSHNELGIHPRKQGGHFVCRAGRGGIAQWEQKAGFKLAYSYD